MMMIVMMMIGMVFSSIGERDSVKQMHFTIHCIALIKSVLGAWKQIIVFLLWRCTRWYVVVQGLFVHSGGGICLFKESTASAEALEIGNSVKNPSAFKKSSSNPYTWTQDTWEEWAGWSRPRCACIYSTGTGQTGHSPTQTMRLTVAVSNKLSGNLSVNLGLLILGVSFLRVIPGVFWVFFLRPQCSSE